MCDGVFYTDTAIEPGAYYKGWSPEKGWEYRRVLAVSQDKTRVQYDGESVGSSRYFPYVPMIDFQLWAIRRVSKEEVR